MGQGQSGSGQTSLCHSSRLARWWSEPRCCPPPRRRSEAPCWSPHSHISNKLFFWEFLRYFNIADWPCFFLHFQFERLYHKVSWDRPRCWPIIIIVIIIIIVVVIIIYCCWPLPCWASGSSSVSSPPWPSWPLVSPPRQSYTPDTDQSHKQNNCIWRERVSVKISEVGHQMNLFPFEFSLVLPSALHVEMSELQTKRVPLMMKTDLVQWKYDLFTWSVHSRSFLSHFGQHRVGCSRNVSNRVLCFFIHWNLQFGIGQSWDKKTHTTD